jgi:triosephosphate isomerase
VVRCAESNITPVICVGESLKEREDGEANTVIERQLSVALQKISDDQAANVVIAYEPVWAIGTGRSASPEQVQETHAFLRRVLEARSSSLSQVSILYGGSVKVETAADLFRQPDVDGGLVGNASLDASQLLNIFKALS